MWNQSDREPGVPVHDGQKERIPGRRHDLNKCTLQPPNIDSPFPFNISCGGMRSVAAPRWPSRVCVAIPNSLLQTEDLTIQTGTLHGVTRRELRPLAGPLSTV